MENIFLIGIPGGMELFVILFVVLLLFGGKKIPELMRGVGKGIREFNSARATIESEIKEGMKESDKKEIEEKKG
jgi:sec-independent protein translocase protein TatA